MTALNALGIESPPADVRVEGEADDAGPTPRWPTPAPRLTPRPRTPTRPR
ncbi:MAG: hypothetical protein H6704_28880 [Myxococcales bacterium]|nr:hypothetical protein [Myxococcales bacterium]